MNYQTVRLTENELLQILVTHVHLNSIPNPNFEILTIRNDLPNETIGQFNPALLEIKIIEPKKDAQDLSDKILSILLHGKIRRGSINLILPFIPEFQEKIKASIEHELPIEIALPTIPFKCQNPLSTQHSLSWVDLGECLFFRQLKSICASIERIYPPGVKITLISDGLVYAHIFANSQNLQTIKQIIKYRNNCGDIAKTVGLNGQVTIIDMVTVIQSMLGHNPDEILALRDRVRDLLSKAQSQNGLIEKYMQSLQRGMLFNLPFSEYGYAEFIDISNLSQQSLPMPIKTKIRNAALDYASFLIVLYLLEIIRKAFPKALRATVHPKNAPQIPLHLVNEHSAVLPHNGVPVVSERRLIRTNSISRSARIVKFRDVISSPDIVKVNIADQQEPFYYLNKNGDKI